MHDWQSVISSSSSQYKCNDRVTAWWCIKRLAAWMLCLEFIQGYFFHCIYFNPAPGVKQDEQAGFYSSTHQLVNRQANTNHTVKSPTHHTVQFWWYLLTPHNNNSIQNKTERTIMKWMHVDFFFLAVFCLCWGAIAAYSGRSSILLPRFNSCPLIYIPNLATIKIPGQLINRLSHNSSTYHPDLLALTTLPCVADASSTPSKCVCGEHWPCLMWALRDGLWACNAVTRGSLMSI